MLLLPLVIAVSIFVFLIAGALFSFLVLPLFCGRLRDPFAGGLFLKILLTPVYGALFFFLFWAFVFVHEQNASKDYWNYDGAYDWYRMPLEYPYELQMIDVIDEASIGVFAHAAGSVSKDISDIRRYYKQGPLVLGQCDRLRWDDSAKPSWFIFDCNTGHAQIFSTKDEYLSSIKKHGFEREPALLTVRENWDRYWASKK